MWLKKDLLALQVNNLSIRQHLDLIQDNAYIRCNLSSIVRTRNTFNLVTKDKIIENGISLKYEQDSNIAWDNICTYLRLSFPQVWSSICESDILPINKVSSTITSQLRNIDDKINSCRNFLEVFRSLVYGSPLRLPFSQDISLQSLYSNLLILCQKSDILGFGNLAGQKRVIFLQNWIEKLVLSSSLPSYFAATLPNSSPVNFIKKEPARVTEKKYIVTKRPVLKSSLVHFKNKNFCDTSQSSQSHNTTFSSYLNRQDSNPSKFVGLKLKFDISDSDTSYNSDSSTNSVWDPVFTKKRKNL